MCFIGTNLAAMTLHTPPGNKLPQIAVGTLGESRKGKHNRRCPSWIMLDCQLHTPLSKSVIPLCFYFTEIPSSWMIIQAVCFYMIIHKVFSTAQAGHMPSHWRDRRFHALLLDTVIDFGWLGELFVSQWTTLGDIRDIRIARKLGILGIGQACDGVVIVHQTSVTKDISKRS